MRRQKRNTTVKFTHLDICMAKLCTVTLENKNLITMIFGFSNHIVECPL